jgi:hypothetical protein
MIFLFDLFYLAVCRIVSPGIDSIRDGRTGGTQPMLDELLLLGMCGEDHMIVAVQIGYCIPPNERPDTFLKGSPPAQVLSGKTRQEIARRNTGNTGNVLQPQKLKA